MKTIVLNPASAKSLDRIAEPFPTTIAEALAAHALGKLADVKAMQGTTQGVKTVRMRIGDYRVIFDETAERITVLALGHCGDIYR